MDWRAGIVMWLILQAFFWGGIMWERHVIKSPCAVVESAPLQEPSHAR